MMQSEGNTVTPTVFAGVSALLNMILDPLFIFTFGLGVVGAAYATLLSKGLLAIIAIYFMFSGKTYVKPNFKNFKFDLHILKRCMKIGLPSSIGQSGSAIGFMVLNFFVTSYGTATLAAFGMVNRITSLVSQPAMGIGAALVAIVGQNIGANQMKRVKEAFWKSFILAFSLGAIGCIILLWKDTEIIHFFIRSTDDDEVIRQSIHFLGYLAYSMPLMGIFSVYTGIFQGSSHTKYAMAMEIGRLWAIRLPMILLFKHFTTIGETGIWFSMSFSNLIICIYAMTIYVRGKWAMQK
jgi:putative MATE family efflux protein